MQCTVFFLKKRRKKGKVITILICHYGIDDNFILNNLIRKFKRSKKFNAFVCLFICFFPTILREDKDILVKILTYVIKQEKGKKNWSKKIELGYILVPKIWKVKF